MADTLYEDLTTHMTVSRVILLKIRNASEKSVEKIRTHILRSVTFFFRKSCCLLDNSENTVQSDRPQMTIRRMRFACWISKVTHTEVYSIYCYSTAKMVTQTRLVVTSNVHSLSYHTILSLYTFLNQINLNENDVAYCSQTQQIF